MKHNVMTKFLLLNLGYTHHAIRIFVYMKSAIEQLLMKEPTFNVFISTKMGTGRLE